MDVTLATVLYKPDWSRTGRILRDVLAAADACGLLVELLVIDNSPNPTVEALGLAAAQDRARVIWNQGYNIYLAGALTTAVREARGDAFVYVCASHGIVNDPSWISDLVAPLADPRVGLAGHVQPCEFNRVAAVPEDIVEPQIHVQGGVWTARTGLLREIGFGHRFPFEFCDVDLSRRCLAAGYELASVPSVVSIAGGVIPDPERYKYVHDYR
jgi:GT2 family glycosyltransferase